MELVEIHTRDPPDGQDAVQSGQGEEPTKPGASAACRGGQGDDTTSTSAGGSEAPSFADVLDGACVLGGSLSSIEVKPWDAGCFTLVAKLQDTSRNHGKVVCMVDNRDGAKVAVKEMSNAWVCENHEAFLAERPNETERPWVDVACSAFLSREGFPYVCEFKGVFRDSDCTRLVTALAAEGDLFSWCQASADDVAPGPAREHLLRPLLAQLSDAMRCLHDLAIVHGDISMENILVTGCGDSGLRIQIIDFGNAGTDRYMPASSHVGKEAYRAPEMMAGSGAYDGFLSDAFAVGIVSFCALFLGFPWLSASPSNACASFRYCRDNGFSAFARRRRIPAGGYAADRMSFEVGDLLEGLLAVDVSARFSLGEEAWHSESTRRNSVWDLPWFGACGVGPCERQATA